MMRNRLITAMLILTALLNGHQAFAQFFDTSTTDEFFRLGVRMGINMSNVSAGGSQQNYNHDSWGSGFEMGAVADLSIRNWFSIQPGIFYQSRSNSYTHIFGQGSERVANIGHTLYYQFNIPILFVARFNISDNLKWTLDAGPYISIGLGHNDAGISFAATNMGEKKYDRSYFKDRHHNDCGLKTGTGLELYDHYYLSIHYMSGFGNPWKNDLFSGHNKAWSFTIGYNF